MGIFSLWHFFALAHVFETGAAFSHTQNTPRKSREGNQMVFSKEKQTIVSYWRFFHETKEKLENISLMFSSCNH